MFCYVYFKEEDKTDAVEQEEKQETVAEGEETTAKKDQDTEEVCGV